MFVLYWLLLSLVTNDFLGRGPLVLSWIILPIFYQIYVMWEAASSAKFMVYPLERYNRWYVYAAALLMGFSVAVFFRATVANAHWVGSAPMESSIKHGEQILVRQWGIGGLKGLFANDTDIRRGDIITFEANEHMLPRPDQMPAKRRLATRRVVAVGGDEVELKNNLLYLNGRQEVEPYALESDPLIYPPAKVASRSEYQKLWETGKLMPSPIESLRDNFGPVTVPPGMFFVLGDNRDYARDSRYWGPITDDMIQGRVVRVLWSWDSNTHHVRWDRLGQPIH
jgi:signal peptidase I